VTGEHWQVPPVQLALAVQATDEVLTGIQVTLAAKTLQTSPEAHAPVVHGIPSPADPIGLQVDAFPNDN
jgi:hypothetical protein